MNLQHWQHTETVTMEVSDGAQVQEYRLVLATCNNYDIALFNRRRVKVFAHLTERFGEGWGDRDEAIALLNIMIQHLVVLAALKRVEIKDGETWTETKLPDAWYDVQRFPEEVPAGVVEVLTEAAFAAGNSARLFSLAPTEGEKKVLRLTVSPSAT